MADDEDIASMCDGAALAVVNDAALLRLATVNATLAAAARRSDASEAAVRMHVTAVRCSDSRGRRGRWRGRRWPRGDGGAHHRRSFAGAAPRQRRVRVLGHAMHHQPTNVIAKC
jgi:hypothetical protein